MRKYFSHILILTIFTGIMLPLNFAQAAWWDLPSFSDMFTAAITTVLYFILTFVAYFLWLAGTFLDYVLKFTVVDIRTNISSLVGINIAWKMIKDLMNIVFIFMLVYQGIMLIIGRENTENIKKFIIGIVLSAILINFSLFFTKVLIDASNVVSVGFYNAIISGTASVNLPNPGTAGYTSFNVQGISAPFMANLGLSNFWSSTNITNIQSSTDDNWSMVLLPVMGIILFIIVAFVFFAISVIFAVRFLTLIILLILSPVAYMGLALDGMRTYANQWWNALNSQLIFAPVYMIMTWVTLNLMNQFSLTNASWSSLVSPNGASGTPTGAGPVSLVFNFFIIIGLAIASLIISKSTSNNGSKHIAKMTGQFTTTAGNTVFGTTAWAGRRSLGALSNRVANDDDLKDRASKGGVSGFAARMQLDAANRLAGSTFDLRATKGFNRVADVTESGKNAFGKVDIKKDNYRAQLEAKTKEETEKLKRYKVSDETVEKAKAILDGTGDPEEVQKYKEENEKQRNEFFNSEVFKNSDIYKNAKKAEEEELKLKELMNNENKDIKRLQELESSKIELTGQDAEIRKQEISDLKKKIEDDKKIKDDLIKTRNERSRTIEDLEVYKKTYNSDIAKYWIARKGGQDEEKDKKTGRVTKQAVDSQFAVRAKDIAQRYENGGVMTKFTDVAYRYGVPVAGGIGGMVAGGYVGVDPVAAAAVSGVAANQIAKTIDRVRRGERTTIARKIRAEAKPKEKAEDIMKKMLKATGEISEEEPKEETKEEAPKEEPKTT